MVLSEDDIIRLFRIRRTVMQMLRDRKFLVGDSDINMTREQFVEKYEDKMTRKDLTICKARKDDSSDQIYVFFHPEPKVNITKIKSYVDQMRSDNVRRAILVVQEKLTAFTLNTLSDDLLAKYNMHIEVFQEAELLVNVTEHFLVPEHQVLTDEEKKTLLQQYTVKETQLPRIQVTDPIARYHGLRRGQVVKITRSSETAGRYVTYRYAV